MAVSFCTHCGARLRTGARFCPRCGNAVQNTPSTADASRRRPSFSSIWVVIGFMGSVVVVGLVVMLVTSLLPDSAEEASTRESLVPNTPVPTPVNRDRAALMALYNSTGGAQWKNNWNWGTDRPLEKWTGVTTNRQGRVTELRLGSNGLTGTIPPEIGSLTELETLYLGAWAGGNNNVAGNIPPELGNLGNLRSLKLANNELTGTIPPELSNLANLESLDLYNNELTGTIPPELGNLTSLRDLNLMDNELTGIIPTELGNLTSLQSLVLGFNDLTGNVPPQLGNLTSMEFLAIHNNDLTGELPLSLTMLTEVGYFAFLGNDGLCAPLNSIQDWLQGVGGTESGPTCPK